MRNRGWAAAGTATGFGGLVLLLAACGSSATSTDAGAAYGGSGTSPTPAASPMSGAGTTSGMGTRTVSLTIKATRIGQVLTDARGDTLYFYAKDAKGGPSTCTGACETAWPRVPGQAVAAPGVRFAGVLGSVTNPGGAVQATYNGYPLYTYADDMAPGQTMGNGEGGVWHVITGSVLTAASSSRARMSSPSATRSASGTGGGYGTGYGTGTKVGSTASGPSGTAGAATRTTHTAPAPPPSVAPAPPSTPAAPAPAPTSSVNGGGCGSGACW
ncbi:MAG TPA: hypothetical protein VGD68_03420 [Streptosporangiaceae bacterium]